MQNFYQHSMFSADYAIILFFYAKITLNADAQCVDVNIGGRKYALRCVIGNVGDDNFWPSFYKKQYLNNGQACCREISHEHCKYGISWYKEK